MEGPYTKRQIQEIAGQSTHMCVCVLLCDYTLNLHWLITMLL